VLRDLKPSNLLATPLAEEDGEPGASDLLPVRSLVEPMPEWVVKVCDLGIARRATDQAREQAAELTSTGMFLGTADYCSPEQAAAPRRIDARADLYSLGAAFYFLLTGLVPFSGGSAREKLARHRSAEKPLAVQCLRPEVPGRVAAVVCNLMAKNPEDR